MAETAVPGTVPSLPPELEEAIFQQLLTAGSVTIRESVGENPQLTRSYGEFNGVLANVCQASRRFNQIGTRVLYHTVVLRDMRQLICFFRTLATVPHLRGLVRSLVWAGVIPLNDLSAGNDIGLTASRSMMALVGDTWMFDLTMECWKGVAWPLPGDKRGKRIARNLDLVDPIHFCSGHILGAVLALCPNIESLFTVLNQTNRMIISPKGRVLRRCPEFSGILQIPEWDLFQYHAPIPGSVPYPLQCRFLSSLRSISIEPHSDRNAESYWTIFALEPLLRSCPQLEHVEVKGTVSWRELRTRGNDWQPPAVFSDNVKQLVLTRAVHPEDNMPTIAETFPKLEALYAEFVETSHAGTYRAWLTREHFQDALASLSSSLETLHFTSAPAENWQFTSVQPLLHPVLRKMAVLKHLVTESAWLFGWENLALAFDPTLLPQSLVSLHVIDFWGALGDKYYPAFPGGMGPLDFMSEMLNGILAGYQADRLSSLKAVRISSPCFSTLLPRELRAGSIITPEAVRAFRLRFAAAFAEVGVEFSFAGPVERLVHGQWHWSRVPYY